MFSYQKYYYPYVSPFDPCPPIRVKTYETPPQLYIGYQAPSLPQFKPRDALKHGTLWPLLYAPYDSQKKHFRREEGSNRNEEGRGAT